MCPITRNQQLDEFSWADTQQAAFTDIKQKVTSACALQYFDPGAPVTLQVDASDYGIGATLLQKNHPVAYSSTTLTKSEKDNYAQIERECLAIVHAMTRWDQWLYGHHHIVVESDHKPLETIFKHPISHGRVVTSSRQITEVEQRRARSVLGWVTAARVTLLAMCRGVGQAFHITPPLSTQQ